MSMFMPHLSRAGSSSHAGFTDADTDEVAGTPQESSESVRARERLIDEELAQSFPASDPPGWVHGAAPMRSR